MDLPQPDSPTSDRVSPGLRSKETFSIATAFNPPFAGKNTIAEGSPDGILDWFKQLHPESHGNADLVAHFFRRTEPHSPVAYLAEKAVKWGEMPLHEWLSQVIKDQGAMSHLEELLGLDKPAHDHG